MDHQVFKRPEKETSWGLDLKGPDTVQALGKTRKLSGGR